MDKKRLLELAGITEGRNIVSSSAGSKIDRLIDDLGAALFEEGTTLAKEVFDNEGPGKSGIDNRAKYVKYALKRFLDANYKKEIMENIIEAYNDNW